MSEFELKKPHFTTIWGGLGIIIYGLVAGFASFGVMVPISDGYSFPFYSIAPALVSSAIFAVAFGILVFGIRGESSIVGTSALAKAALIVYGCSDVLLRVVNELVTKNLVGPNGPTDDAFAALALVGWVTFSFEVIVLIAAAFAARAIVRVHILTGVARWMLLVVVAWNAVFMIIMVIPSLGVGYAFASLQAGSVAPILLLVLGFSYLLHGHSAAIRQRLHVINEHW